MLYVLTRIFYFIFALQLDERHNSSTSMNCTLYPNIAYKHYEIISILKNNKNTFLHCKLTESLCEHLHAGACLLWKIKFIHNGNYGKLFKNRKIVVHVPVNGMIICRTWKKSVF